MNRCLGLLLFCCLLTSCRYLDDVFAKLPPKDCRKWSDVQNYGFRGPVKSLSIEQGFAVMKDGEWELDSGRHLFFGYEFRRGPFTYASISINDNLLSYKEAISIDNDYVVHYEMYVDGHEELMGTDTLHWLDTFHAVWDHYRVETDTSLPHVLLRHEQYTLDAQCRVSELVTDTYDSGRTIPTRRVQRIAPDAENNHLLSATELDPQTKEILERSANGNPLKVLYRCKECHRPCLMVYKYTYGE